MKSEEQIKKKIEQYKRLIKRVSLESQSGSISYDEYTIKLEKYYSQITLLEWVLRWFHNIYKKRNYIEDILNKYSRNN